MNGNKSENQNKTKFPTADRSFDQINLEQLIGNLKEQIEAINMLRPKIDSKQELTNKNISIHQIYQQFIEDLKNPLFLFEKLKRTNKTQTQQQEVVQLSNSESMLQKFIPYFSKLKNDKKLNEEQKIDNEDQSIFMKLNIRDQTLFFERMCFNYFIQCFASITQDLELNYQAKLKEIKKNQLESNQTFDNLKLEIASLQKQLKNFEIEKSQQLSKSNPISVTFSKQSNVNNQTTQTIKQKDETSQKQQNILINNSNFQVNISITQTQPKKNNLKLTDSSQQTIDDRLEIYQVLSYQRMITVNAQIVPKINDKKLPSSQIITLLLSQRDEDKKFLTKSLFQNEKIQLYQKYFQKDLGQFIVDTDPFEFEIIDEREKQIVQYQKIFRDNWGLNFCLWIAIKFERLDIMKNYFMSIYKFFRGLNIPICMIVTDFHLSENTKQDKEDIRNKFQLFQLYKIIFVKQNLTIQNLIWKLKIALPCCTADTKDTIFAEQDLVEMQNIFDNLTNHIRGL